MGYWRHREIKPGPFLRPGNDPKILDTAQKFMKMGTTGTIRYSFGRVRRPSGINRELPAAFFYVADSYSPGVFPEQNRTCPGVSRFPPVYRFVPGSFLGQFRDNTGTILYKPVENSGPLPGCYLSAFGTKRGKIRYRVSLPLIVVSQQ